MADISKIARLVSGITRNVDISQNTLVVSSLKVGASSPSELTKAILDNLISLQNGSDIGASLHHHDGLYFTETELGSATSSSGSDLIGDDDTYSNFDPTAATVKGALAGIDSALGSVVGNAEFLDGSFRIKNTAAPTKKIAFSAAGITADTIRTITMPDADVDLGNLTNDNISASAGIAYSKLNLSNNIVGSDIAPAAGIELDKLYALTASRAIYSNASGIITASDVTSAELGYLSGVTSAIQIQFNNMSSLIQNFEWQASVKDRLATPPGSPVDGDRYLIIATATGDWAGRENEIVTWNDGLSQWDSTYPAIGMFVGVDDESDGLYVYGGSAWDKKYFEATTASTGLTKVGFDIRLDSSSAGDGLGFSSGVLSVNTDDTTIEKNSDALRVKAGGISNSHIASDAAIARSKIAAGTADHVVINDGSGNLSSVARLPLNKFVSPGAAGKILVGADANDFASVAMSGDATIAASGAITVANSAKSAVFSSYVAAESITAGHIVYVNSDGKVAKALANAEATCVAVIGIANNSAAADGAVLVQVAGKRVVNIGDMTGNLGKRVYVDASTAGSGTITAPSAINSVVFLMGISVSATEIEIQPHLEYVND